MPVLVWSIYTVCTGRADGSAGLQAQPTDALAGLSPALLQLVLFIALCRGNQAHGPLLFYFKHQKAAFLVYEF